MIEIKTVGDGEMKVSIKGTLAKCSNEMANAAIEISKINPFIAEAFILGLAITRSKEDLHTIVDCAYSSLKNAEEDEEELIRQLLLSIIGEKNNEQNNTYRQPYKSSRS